MLHTDVPTQHTSRACPACGSQTRREIAHLAAEQFCKVNSTYRADFATVLDIPPDAVYPLARCAACGFVYAALLLPDEFLERVYDRVIDAEQGFFESCSPGWVAHQLALGSRFLDQLQRQYSEKKQLKVLDFGCGYGTLVQAVSGPRISCVGFETSPKRLDYLRRQGLEACSTQEEVMKNGPYHGIVLSDVLEHVLHPRETLTLCRNLLVDNGVLCVHVPNFSEERLNQELAELSFGRQTRELNPWEHLNYFSPASLRQMVRTAGFRLLEPGTIDVGLRPGLRGVRRWGNAVKSMLRLLRYAAGGLGEETALLAQRGAGADLENTR
jgi:2-polyprenyl-3-methyl-5-hydroxy-6-metoxy-1,4-benzoquinol methylase